MDDQLHVGDQLLRDVLPLRRIQLATTLLTALLRGVILCLPTLTHDEYNAEHTEYFDLYVYFYMLHGNILNNIYNSYQLLIDIILLAAQELSFRLKYRENLCRGGVL